MSPPIKPPPSGTQPGESVSFDHWLNRVTRNAAQHPDLTAVVSGTRKVSYGELAERSDRIASLLRQKGIGMGTYVGAGFHRSDDLIAALLGIIKSGAAYIPLDPGYPVARIAQMIASANLKTVVTHTALAESFGHVDTVLIDNIVAAATDESTPNAGDPVYAIFTSGSTGQPKAASVFHSGFANLLNWYACELDLGPNDRTLVISSPSFDLTQKNLFIPLITGGTLVLDECLTYDITRILGLIREHGITLLNCTPSAFYPLVDAASGDNFKSLASLRFAVLGGEPISVPRLRAWLENPQCRAEVVNSYGPTECTDICLFHRMHRGNLDGFPFVPLGREIPNVDVTIRDGHLELLPVGETGELCIGGTGVGGGYLFDPARTADRFVDAIYRTGDLAKRLPCGTFEFRGRADHQVKVNGFRIELGEIEIVINEHESVREAVVTSNSGNLTAHVHGRVSVEDLRAHLATRLPAYMIPAEFRFVEDFPLTPNGKVDRAALVETTRPAVPELPAISNTSLESGVLALWSEVLKRPVSDPTANFFDLGGSSINLAVVHVRLREMTGKDFPITDLFARPNARSIAVHLSPKQAGSAANSTQERARLAKTSFSRFQRPLSR